MKTKLLSSIKQFGLYLTKQNLANLFFPLPSQLGDPAIFPAVIVEHVPGADILNSYAGLACVEEPNDMITESSLDVAEEEIIDEDEDDISLTGLCAPCSVIVGIKWLLSSQVAQTVKRLSSMWETRVRSLGREDPLEKEIATHSSTIAWKTPWMEEPGRLQSRGSQRVGHD